MGVTPIEAARRRMVQIFAAYPEARRPTITVVGATLEIGCALLHDYDVISISAIAQRYGLRWAILPPLAGGVICVRLRYRDVDVGRYPTGERGSV